MSIIAPSFRLVLAPLIALFAADQICTAGLNIARRQWLAHVEHGAWWPSIFAAHEAFELLVYLLVFLVLGAVLAAVFRKTAASVAAAFALGCSYSAIGFALEPDFPFARYAHAPSWLWWLSWSLFYMPAIASAVGALAASLLLARRRGEVGT